MLSLEASWLPDGPGDAAVVARSGVHAWTGRNKKKTIYVPFSISLGARTSISVRGRKKYWVEKKLKIDVMNEVKCAIGSPAFLRQVSLHKFSSRGSNSELESLELCYNALNAISFFFSS